jgi:hypothetical protein
MPPHIDIDDVEVMRFVELIRRMRDDRINMTQEEEDEYYTLLIRIVRGF